MDKVREKLSDDLKVIYDYEISKGNIVLRVDEPAGTLCPLAIVFKKPFIKFQTTIDLNLGKDIVWHENDDPHYELDGMAGFTSKTSHHFIYGPIRSNR